jgi:tripartite-type tricarboxylate transporter receptor subunit TctC
MTHAIAGLFKNMLRALGMPVMAAPLAILPSLSGAADYPNKPITLVVAYAPGGMGDSFARTVAERMSLALKQTVLVDNKPGATGAIGTKLVAKVGPDGYTLLLGQTGEIAINMAVMKNPGYDPIRELKPVILIGDAPLVMVAPSSAPYSTVREVAQAAQAKPGAMTYASSGTATPGHLAAAAMVLGTKSDVVHAPYKGAGPALTDVLGGHVAFFFSSAPAALPQVRAGKLKAIAVSSATRMPTLPNVPTVAETLPGFAFSLWGGLFAPADTPVEVVATLNRELNKIIADPAVKQKIEDQGAIVRANTPDEFTEFVRKETAKYQQIVKQIGIVAE